MESRVSLGDQFEEESILEVAEFLKGSPKLIRSGSEPVVREDIDIQKEPGPLGCQIVQQNMRDMRGEPGFRIACANGGQYVDSRSSSCQ